MQAFWCHSFLLFLLGRCASAVQSAVSAGLEDQRNKHDVASPVDALQGQSNQDAMAGEKSPTEQVLTQNTEGTDEQNREAQKIVSLGTVQKAHIDEALQGVPRGNAQWAHQGFGDASGRSWGGYYFSYYSRQPSLLQSGQIPYLQKHAKLVNEYHLNEHGHFQTAQKPKNEKYSDILPGMRPIGFWGEGWLEIPQGRFNAIGFGWYYYNGRPVYGLNRRGTGKLPRKHGFVPWWRPPYVSAHGMPKRYWSWLANRGVAHHTAESDEKAAAKAKKIVKEAEKTKEAIEKFQNATNKVRNDAEKSRIDKLKKVLGV